MDVETAWTLRDAVTLEPMSETQIARCEIPFKRSYGRGWGFQCRAIKRNGDRCRKFALQGGVVCLSHGGNLPAVRSSAKDTFRLLGPRAAGKLGELLDSTDERVAIRAINLIFKYADMEPARERYQGHGQPELPPPPTPTPSTQLEIEAAVKEITSGE